MIFKRLVLKYIDSGTRSDQQEIINQRVRFVNGFSVIGFLSALLFGFIQLTAGNIVIGLVEISMGLLAIVNVIALRRYKVVNVNFRVVLGIMLVLLTALLLSGGIASSGLFWFFLMPALTFFLADLIEGWLWIIALISITILLTFTQDISGITVPFDPTLVRQAVFVLLALSLIISIYKIVQNTFIVSLDERNKELEKTNKHLQTAINSLALSEEKLKQANSSITDQLNIIEQSKEAILGILEDLEEQKNISDELYEYQKAILNGTEYSVIATTPEGIITKFNRGAENMLGYKAEEIVDIQTPAIIHKPDEVVARAKLLSKELGHNVEIGFETFIVKARETKEADRNEWTYITKKKKEIPVMLSVTALRNSKDKIIGYLGIAVDITKEKELEQSKDDFLSIASHQLQSPATAVKQYIGAILEGYFGKISKEQKENLEYAYQSNESQLHIVHDMLNVSRLQSGRIELKPSQTDVSKLLEKNLKSLKHFFVERKQKLQVHIDKKLIAEVDENLISMVIDNFVSNASKYTPDGGSIDITLNKSSKNISLSVKDNGVGITSKQIDSLFTRFGRFENKLSTLRGGTGLGLFIAKKIIDMHNGTIKVESKLNKGTTFTIKLPIKRRAE